MFITGREADKLSRATGQENTNTDLIFTPTPEIFQGRYEVEVERGSTELRNPQVQAQKLRQIVTLMTSAMPMFLQLGVPFNMRRLLELWLDAEGIDDVDALFESDEDMMAMQQLAVMQQAQAAMGGGGAGGAPNAGGAGRTQPGEPRPETTNAPQDMITSDNSGMLAPR